MAYQWGTGTTDFDADTPEISGTAHHTATGRTVSISCRAWGVGPNDADQLAVLGDFKEALEAGGFTNVVITNRGVATETLEEV